MEVKIFVGSGWRSTNELPEAQKLLHCLHYEVQKRQTQLGEQKPVVVICRNGATQSGLYCAVCNILDGIDWYNEVNIYHCVRQLQIRKPEVIRSKTQYQYCYQVALNYLNPGDVYENTTEEERETEYANVGDVRLSLEKDPLIKLKGQGGKQGPGEIYSNVGAVSKSSDDPFDPPSNREPQTTI